MDPYHNSLGGVPSASWSQKPQQQPQAGGKPSQAAQDAQILSVATAQAMAAAQSILMSGGSEATALSTARAAAQSVLLAHNSASQESSRAFRSKRKAKNQAQVVASMALVTVKNNMEQFHGGVGADGNSYLPVTEVPVVDAFHSAAAGGGGGGVRPPSVLGSYSFGSASHAMQHNGSGQSCLNPFSGENAPCKSSNNDVAAEPTTKISVVPTSQEEQSMARGGGSINEDVMSHNKMGKRTIGIVPSSAASIRTGNFQRPPLSPAGKRSRAGKPPMSPTKSTADSRSNAIPSSMPMNKPSRAKDIAAAVPDQDPIYYATESTVGRTNSRGSHEEDHPVSYSTSDDSGADSFTYDGSTTYAPTEYNRGENSTSFLAMLAGAFGCGSQDASMELKASSSAQEDYDDETRAEQSTGRGRSNAVPRAKPPMPLTTNVSPHKSSSKKVKSPRKTIAPLVESTSTIDSAEILRQLNLSAEEEQFIRSISKSREPSPDVKPWKRLSSVLCPKDLCTVASRPRMSNRSSRRSNTIDRIARSRAEQSEHHLSGMQLEIATPNMKDQGNTKNAGMTPAEARQSKLMGRNSRFRKWLNNRKQTSAE